ncbi:GGDEF domain-containing protein [Pseudacidovorax intermedius]|nr:GGDEF domain-containing protein [Pseudacidovorax intermedius]
MPADKVGASSRSKLFPANLETMNFANKSFIFGLGLRRGGAPRAGAPVSQRAQADHLDDLIVGQLRHPARLLAGAAAAFWLMTLALGWPVLAPFQGQLLFWTSVQAAGLVVCLAAERVVGHDGGVGLMTVAMAAGYRLQLEAWGGGGIWVLPLCLLLALYLGLMQVRLRSYLLSSIAVWLVLCHGLLMGQLGGSRALLSVLVAGSFGLALVLHRGVSMTRRRRVAVAEELTRLAYQDALTGIANRRGFLAGAKARLEAGGGLGLIALDVDDFKKINDTHGHEVGDRVLEAFGQMLARLPPQALSGRMGGEEFCVLLPAASAQQLLEGAQGLVRRARFIQVRQVGMSVSAGAALVLPGEDLQDALRRADAALSLAKAQGKDRALLDAEASAWMPAR